MRCMYACTAVTLIGGVEPIMGVCKGKGTGVVILGETDCRCGGDLDACIGGEMDDDI
jgi:hypothetical protein